MSNNLIDLDFIKNFPKKNPLFLRFIIKELNQVIKGNRRIMYSDIINFIVKKGIKDELSKQLLLWCNYRIRIGEIFGEVKKVKK